jgi:hypothetical protein
VTSIEVDATRKVDGWTCQVIVADAGGSSRHRVSVGQADLARLDPGAPDPAPLVRRSFEFLLTREPRTAILASFDLVVIGRYFPDYEATIRGDV